MDTKTTGGTPVWALPEQPERGYAPASTEKTCGKNFRIEKAELNFYKNYKLPIPKNCPDCRHSSRLALRNPRALFESKCRKCGTDFKSTYPSGAPEKVYCEKCYLETMY